MKKTLVVGLAIGLVSLAAAAFAANDLTLGRGNRGGSGIVGSSHDLSNVGGQTASVNASGAVGTGAAQDAQSRICVYCHHPHNTMTSAAAGGYSPLWNRSLSAKTFSGYNNGIMMNPATLGSDKRHALNATATQLQGVSLLCMSCHDGAVALNAYSVGTGSAGDGDGGGAALTGDAAFAGNLTNHHPMGFAYDPVAVADAEIRPATSTMWGTVTIGDLLYGSTRTMECVTCHDVHNSGNAPDAERFLWKSNNKSNFCLACHAK